MAATAARRNRGTLKPGLGNSEKTRVLAFRLEGGSFSERLRSTASSEFASCGSQIIVGYAVLEIPDDRTTLARNRRTRIMRIPSPK